MTGVRRTVAAGACGVLALAALAAIVSWLPGPYGLRRGPSALLLAAAVGYALAHAPLTVRRTRLWTGGRVRSRRPHRWNPSTPTAGRTVRRSPRPARRCWT